MKALKLLAQPAKLMRRGAGGIDPTGSRLVFASLDGDQEERGAKILESFLGCPVEPLRTRTSSSNPAAGLIVDCQTANNFSDLGALLHVAVRKTAIRRGGRLLVLGAVVDGKNASVDEAIIPEVCEGFIRSLAKEVGSNGVTANLLLSHSQSSGAADVVLSSVLPSARFLLSGEAAFITGQRVDVDTALFQEHPTGLSGQRCVVTGAARGIGRATAAALAEQGCGDLLLVSLKKNRAAALPHI